MRLLLAPEAAELLRVTPPRLYELAKRGIVPCVRIGRQVRFPEEKLLAWIEQGGTLSASDSGEQASVPPSPNPVATHDGRR